MDLLIIGTAGQSLKSRTCLDESMGGRRLSKSFLHICLCRCSCRSAQGFRFLCSHFLKSRLQVWSQEFLRSAHIFVMQLNRLLFVFLCICPACSSNVIHLFPNGTRAMDSAFKQVYDHMNKTFDYGLFTKFSKAVQEGACSFFDVFHL